MSATSGRLRRGLLSGGAAIVLLASTELVSAQGANQPAIENAHVEHRDIKTSLAQDVHDWAAAAAKPQWLAYSVPAVSSERHMCCGDGGWNSDTCGTCRLEMPDHGTSFNLRDDKVSLEAPRKILVLFRAEHGRIGKIRVFSEDCTIDGGGLQVIWHGPVNPAESVKLLEGFVDSSELDEHGGDRLSRGALAAIALTGDPSADQAFARFTAPDKPESMRREAAFWEGEARGASGLSALQRMAHSDPSSEVRAQVTFALSISREPGAVNEMIRMAHEDTSAHVRGQALFWLAHKAGSKAASAITGAIEDDPDTEVKKKAVFALSQLPKEEGVPKLIQVAQNNRNPEVRKQAMFWLGQSNDPRALEFFEKVLSK